jgi:hypothetical protein
MKTNIKVQGSTMYRLEILGYAYGSGKNIDSISTGYVLYCDLSFSTFN